MRLPFPARLQIARLRPVLEALRAASLRISVDATDPAVLRFALASGVDWLNDVRGFPDESFYPELASARPTSSSSTRSPRPSAPTARSRAPRQVLDSIERFFEARLAALVRAGVAEERLIIDPGMGFFLGRDPRASIAVLQRIAVLRARFGRPLLVSVSRKSFLRELTGSDLDAIGAATLATELFAARSGADWIRTHDVRALRDGLCIHEALAIDGID